MGGVCARPSKKNNRFPNASPRNSMGRLLGVHAFPSGSPAPPPPTIDNRTHATPNLLALADHRQSTITLASPRASALTDGFMPPDTPNSLALADH